MINQRIKGPLAFNSSPEAAKWLERNLIIKKKISHHMFIITGPNYRYIEYNSPGNCALLYQSVMLPSGYECAVTLDTTQYIVAMCNDAGGNPCRLERKENIGFSRELLNISEWGNYDISAGAAQETTISGTKLLSADEGGPRADWVVGIGEYFARPRYTVKTVREKEVFL